MAQDAAPEESALAMRKWHYLKAKLNQGRKVFQHEMAALFPSVTFFDKNSLWLSIAQAKPPQGFSGWQRFLTPASDLIELMDLQYELKRRQPVKSQVLEEVGV